MSRPGFDIFEIWEKSAGGPKFVSYLLLDLFGSACQKFLFAVIESHMSHHPSHTDPSSTTDPVTNFYTLVRDLSEPRHERRTEERIPISVALSIQPLDLDFQPDGEPFFALTRDFSQGGMGFINSEPFDHKYLRLGIPGHDASTIIGHVCYNLSIGVDQPLYLVGIQFVR
jgi:hypothetical protein